MAEGLSQSVASNLLSALVSGAGYTSLGALYIQLHIGAPGASGASNLATETSRKLLVFGTVTGAQAANSQAVTWTNIAGSQDPTHFSVHSAATAGNFQFSGTITSNPYAAGNTLNFAIGSIVVSFAYAS